MQNSASALKKPTQNGLFPRPAKMGRRSLIIGGTIGVLLLLVPVPELLSEAGIAKLPLRQLYDQSFINSAADTGAFVLLALGLNIVVGYAGLLDLGYAAFFAI